MSVCPICHDSNCVYQRIPELEVGTRYFLNDEEVSEEEFVAAERNAGFYNTLGHPEKPATAGFSTNTSNVVGRVEYSMDTPI